MKAIGISSSGRKGAYSKIIVKDILMAVIATFTDPGHQQCYDCGCGHDCVVGNVYKHMGLTTKELAQANRPEEYGIEAQKRATGLGTMLGSILENQK